mmetsp:Transcript_109559/g.320651  ORF Transcript_109559/g.320651 Transcript_109559/m.320651 type:complete len:220 (-) Transcript_109559:713-1372(-)
MARPGNECKAPKAPVLRGRLACIQGGRGLCTRWRRSWTLCRLDGGEDEDAQEDHQSRHSCRQPSGEEGRPRPERGGNCVGHHRGDDVRDALRQRGQLLRDHTCHPTVEQPDQDHQTSSPIPSCKRQHALVRPAAAVVQLRGCKQHHQGCQALPQHQVALLYVERSAVALQEPLSKDGGSTSKRHRQQDVAEALQRSSRPQSLSDVRDVLRGVATAPSKA